jgi:ABC-type Mn2+/Zn2+ transport system permease subunit
MLIMLQLYGVTIIGASLLASALALLGCHIAMRDQSMQTLCVSQGATLGVLLGIGLAETMHLQPLAGVMPFVAGAAVAGTSFLIGEWTCRRRPASRNTGLSALFALLIAIAAVVSSVFPGLENHMAQRFFGDLATASKAESWIMAATGIILLSVFWKFHRPLLRASFDLAAFGSGNGMLYGENFSRLLTVVSVTISVQVAGFLFTAAALFVPTALLGGSQRSGGVVSHLFRCSLAALFGSVLGFGTSLLFPMLPTAPAMVLAILVVGYLAETGGASRRRR